MHVKRKTVFGEKTRIHMTSTPSKLESGGEVERTLWGDLWSNRMVRYGLVGLLVFVIGGVVAWRLQPPALHGQVLQSPDAIQDFTLMGSTGEEVSLSDFRGEWVVLYFGYTFCPDICPTTLNDLKSMVDTLGERGSRDLQVVMVTVDPERDTVEQLASYLKYFDEGFLGLTGEPAAIEEVATRFGVYFAKSESDSAAGYLVDHTGTVTVVDPDGYVRMLFPYGLSGEDMAADLQYLMRRS